MEFSGLPRTGIGSRAKWTLAMGAALVVALVVALSASAAGTHGNATAAKKGSSTSKKGDGSGTSVGTVLGQVGQKVKSGTAVTPAASNSNDFTCRASGARVDNLLGNVIEPVIANDPGKPCADDSTKILNPNLGNVVSADVLDVSTNLSSDAAKATTKVTNATITGVLTADALTAKASATCNGGNLKLQGSSQVLGLSIGGASAIDVSKPQTINLVVGTLYLNRTIKTKSTITQRALELDSPALSLDVVLGEAVAGASKCGGGGGGGGGGHHGGHNGGHHGGNDNGNPQCSDGVDNDGDGKVDFPNDNGCSSPNDNDERPECSDGVDNDGDGLIDYPNDPGCSSAEDNSEANQCSDGVDNDGDGKVDYPNDPGCTSPQDNDEADTPTTLETPGATCAKAGRFLVGRVGGTGIRSVAFWFNGKRLAMDTTAPFAVRMSAAHPGVMVARVTYLDGRAPRTMRSALVRCPSQAAPRFTG